MNNASISNMGKRGRQGGFTLLEFAFVVALIAAGIYLIFGQNQSTSASSRAADLVKSVSFSGANINNTFHPDFSGITSCTPIVQNSGFKGTSFTSDATTGTVTWGDSAASSLTCGVTNLFATNDGYTLTFSGMTDEECSQFVNKIDTLAWNIAINGTVVKTTRGTLNTATSGAQCSSNSDNETVLITLGRSAPGK